MRRLAIVALLFMAEPAAADVGLPRGWNFSGISWQDYEFGTDAVAGGGNKAAYIKAKPEIRTDGFGGMIQCIKAENYLGKRLRFSARMKGVAASSGQLWMRVDGPRTEQGGAAPVTLGFYNMGDNPIRGTTDWKRYDVVLDAPENSVTICYGFFLAGGRGEVWADNLSLEAVGKDVPVSRSMVIPKAPVNLGFDR